MTSAKKFGDRRVVALPEKNRPGLKLQGRLSVGQRNYRMSACDVSRSSRLIRSIAVPFISGLIVAAVPPPRPPPPPRRVTLGSSND
jgi:hypothetical protein